MRSVFPDQGSMASAWTKHNQCRIRIEKEKDAAIRITVGDKNVVTHTRRSGSKNFHKCLVEPIKVPN